MKKLLVIATLVLGTCLANAETNQCLAVYPIGGNRLEGVATGGLIGMGLAHGQRFAYLESLNLPVSDIKVNYKKKDLEKLEQRGVRIVVTTKEAVTKTRQHNEQNSGDSSSGSSTTTTQATAGCN